MQLGTTIVQNNDLVRKKRWLELHTMLEIPPREPTPEEEKMFKASKRVLIAKAQSLVPVPELSRSQNWAIRTAKPKHVYLRLLVMPEELEKYEYNMQIFRKVRQRCRDVFGSSEVKTDVHVKMDAQLITSMIDTLDPLDRKALADYFIKTEWSHWLSHDFFHYRIVKDVDNEWVAKDGNTEECLELIAKKKQPFRDKLEGLYTDIVNGQTSKQG